MNHSLGDPYFGYARMPESAEKCHFPVEKWSILVQKVVISVRSVSKRNGNRPGIMDTRKCTFGGK